MVRDSTNAEERSQVIPKTRTIATMDNPATSLGTKESECVSLLDIVVTSKHCPYNTGSEPLASPPDDLLESQHTTTVHVLPMTVVVCWPICDSLQPFRVESAAVLSTHQMAMRGRLELLKRAGQIASLPGAFPPGPMEQMSSDL